MTIKKKSKAIKTLEKMSGGPLSFSNLLESIRLGEEASQVDFAKQLGVSRAHLCDIEKGRRTVSALRAAKFAKTLGYSPERFVKLALQDQLDRDNLGLTIEIRKTGTSN